MNCCLVSTGVCKPGLPGNLFDTPRCGNGVEASMSSNLILSSDLTGKARLRQAALSLFSTKGFAGSSLRRIAQRAGVSLALIGHHYGGKAQLRDVVESWIIQLLAQGADPAAERGTSLEGTANAVARRLESVLESEPDVCAYLRRAVLDDGRGDDSQVLALLFSHVQERLAGYCSNASEAELHQWTSQLCTRVLGPIVIAPILRCTVSAARATTAGDVVDIEAEASRSAKPFSPVRPIETARATASRREPVSFRVVTVASG